MELIGWFVNYMSYECTHAKENFGQD